MFSVPGLIEALLAPKGTAYWLVTVAAGAVAAAVFILSGLGVAMFLLLQVAAILLRRLHA